MLSRFDPTMGPIERGQAQASNKPGNGKPYEIVTRHLNVPPSLNAQAADARNEALRGD